MTQTRPADWKQFDDFAAGIATNRLPTTDALNGKYFKIHLDSGRGVTLNFTAANAVQWTEGDSSGADWCEVVEVTTDTFFIDVTFAARPDQEEIFILNTATRRVLSIAERVRSSEEAKGEPRVAQNYVAGIIDDGVAPTGIVPAPSRDLVGITAHYDYSPNHLYEHIYLSSQRYAWQNLIGVQRGHGDVDLATTFKFAENQYVFGFREFIIPVASLFFYNWDDMRSTGKFLGATGAGVIENQPAGAFIIKKSRVDYDAANAPV